MADLDRKELLRELVQKAELYLEALILEIGAKVGQAEMRNLQTALIQDFADVYNAGEQDKSGRPITSGDVRTATSST